jgi:hypothetical protein
MQLAHMVAIVRRSTGYVCVSQIRSSVGMADLIDSSVVRATGYFVVALLAALAAFVDRSSHEQAHSRLWRFSLLLASFLSLFLAVASYGDLSDILTGFGRERAQSAGWYDTRRGVQAAVVAGLFTLWCVSVLVSIYAVPSRRRSYLPAVIGLFTLWGFVAVRLVSYHDVDTLLYSRHLGGARIVAVVEVSLLAATAGAFVFGLTRSSARTTRASCT